MSAPANEGPFVDMALRRIVLRDDNDIQVIYLVEARGERTFTISIGRGEAEEMRRVVARERTARPLTHQLLFESLAAAGAQLVRVEINDLRHNTFYARLVLRTPAGGGEALVDARSSDAIALALRAGCPIRVSEAVLQQVRIDRGPDVLPPPAGEGEGPEEDDEPADPSGGENLEEDRPGDEDAQ